MTDSDDGVPYYLARVGAEKAYRGMRRREKVLPNGLRFAGGLSELMRSDRSHAPSIFRELREFLGGKK